MLSWHANLSRGQQDVIKYFEHAADGGDVSAQVALGQLSEHGIRGVPQDMGKAAMWFRRAANQGDSTAMAQLAGLTAQGLGVPQDNKTALELFQASAKLGNAAGYAGLGHMYMEGAGRSNPLTNVFVAPE